MTITKQFSIDMDLKIFDEWVLDGNITLFDLLSLDAWSSIQKASEAFAKQNTLAQHVVSLKPVEERLNFAIFGIMTNSLAHALESKSLTPLNIEEKNDFIITKKRYLAELETVLKNLKEINILEPNKKLLQKLTARTQRQRVQTLKKIVSTHLSPIIQKIESLRENLKAENCQSFLHDFTIEETSFSQYLTKGNNTARYNSLISYASFCKSLFLTAKREYLFERSASVFTTFISDLKKFSNSENTSPKEARQLIRKLMAASFDLQNCMRGLRDLYESAKTGTFTHDDMLKQANLKKTRELSQESFSFQRLADLTGSSLVEALFIDLRRILDVHFKNTVEGYESYQRQYTRIKQSLSLLISQQSMPRPLSFDTPILKKLEQYNQHVLDAVYDQCSKATMGEVSKAIKHIVEPFSLLAQGNLENLNPSVILLETKGSKALDSIKHKILKAYKKRFEELSLEELIARQENILEEHKKMMFSAFGESIRLFTLLRDLRLFYITDSQSDEREKTDFLISEELSNILNLSELNGVIEEAIAIKAAPDVETPEETKNSESDVEKIDLDITSCPEELPPFKFKTRSVKTKEILEELIELGFIPTPAEGSHIKLRHSETGGVVMIPRKKELKRGTRSSVKSQTNKALLPKKKGKKKK